jgi:O-succinylhomoserine sulfhydrylase
MNQAWRRRTRLIHGGSRRSDFGETSEALFLTSGFRYLRAEDAADRFADRAPGYMYSRVANPTVRMFEERLALLEGAEEAAATATGMAAVHGALMSQLRAGDRVVGARLLFGSCHYILSDLLPRFGVEVVLVDGADLDAWAAALAAPTRLVFFETPGNPTLELIDIAAVAELAHQAGARVIVDNVFATPILQRPLELGADLVVYSATKHIDGQGRCLGGAILSDRALRSEVLQPYLKHTGPALSPFNAWVLLKGLETLDLRVQQHDRHALAVARFLEAHPGVLEVSYPGLPSHPQHALARRQMSGGGSLVAWRTGGGQARAFAVLNRLRLILISNNLGDAKSLITHPATTTHQRFSAEERARLGITDDLLRLSVGLEDPEDLIGDLDQALAI